MILFNEAKGKPGSDKLSGVGCDGSSLQKWPWLVWATQGVRQDLLSRVSIAHAEVPGSQTAPEVISAIRYSHQESTAMSPGGSQTSQVSRGCLKGHLPRLPLLNVPDAVFISNLKHQQHHGLKSLCQIRAAAKNNLMPLKESIKGKPPPPPPPHAILLAKAHSEPGSTTPHGVEADSAGNVLTQVGSPHILLQTIKTERAQKTERLIFPVDCPESGLSECSHCQLPDSQTTQRLPHQPLLARAQGQEHSRHGRKGSALTVRTPTVGLSRVQAKEMTAGFCGECHRKAPCRWARCSPWGNAKVPHLQEIPAAGEERNTLIPPSGIWMNNEMARRTEPARGIIKAGSLGRAGREDAPPFPPSWYSKDGWTSSTTAAGRLRHHRPRTPL